MTRKSKAANHTHRYIRRDLGSEKKPYLVYVCVKPACSHYIKCDLALGKLNECNRCFAEFIYPRGYLIANHGTPIVKPHCFECTRATPKKETLEVIAGFLDEVLPDMPIPDKD